jgi:hypothetical protein
MEDKRLIFTGFSRKSISEILAKAFCFCSSIPPLLSGGNSLREYQNFA